ncbi:MAG: formylglycine-generating enzyme family protein [Treponema sp.]|nr:formylglycine-generating enzyme family protein [Treponema sp.]
MKRVLKLGLAVGLAMAVSLMGCKHESNEPETMPIPSPVPCQVVSGIEGSQVFIDGRTVDIFVAWASDHEVTQAEYKSVMGENPSVFQRNPASGETQENRPVEKVTWYECLIYCNKRSMNEGLTPCYTIKGSTNPSDWGSVPTNYNSDWDSATCNFEANGYRLPTEAEWEYLARGGNTTNSGQTRYSGSDTVEDVAWYFLNCGDKTHEVKKKSPNAFGLYDMSGNVREWCWDWDSEITADTPSVGASSGNYRIHRGGSWFNDYGSVSGRSSGCPFSDLDYYGFRVVRSAN